MVTTFQPATHYARYLCDALSKQIEIAVLVDRDPRNMEVAVLVDRDPRNKDLGTLMVTPCWTGGRDLVRSVLGEVERHKPQVVHLQHEFNMYGGWIGAGLFLLLLVRLRLREIPSVVTLHAVVSPRDISASFLSAFALPRWAAYIVKPLFRLFYWGVCALASHVIIHSSEALGKLEAYYGLKPSKGSVVRHGVPEAVPAVQGKDRSRPYLLFFGYILPRKGLETLWSAHQLLLERGWGIDLVIAGGELPAHRKYAADLRRKMAATIRAHGHVTFTGFLSEACVHSYYAGARAVALPYRISISSSGPLAYAMQHGIPVVATDCEPFREIAREFDFIKLVPADNSAELANALESILCNDNQREHMTAEAYRAAAAWSWGRIAQLTREVYERYA